MISNRQERKVYGKGRREFRFMKFVFTIIFLFAFAFSLFAQKTEEVLATAANKTFTAADLQPEAREAWENRRKLIAEQRQEFFARQVAEILFGLEAAAKKTTVENLLETEVGAKVADPTDAQIKAVYEANRENLGDKTLTDLRPQIVAF